LVLGSAAKCGVGSVASFSYAYLAASTLVGATAFSLGLISSAPLTRRGIDPIAAGRHVVHAAWVSLTIVGAAAGVFALVGGRIVGVVLGHAYSGQVGRDLGHLVVYRALWDLPGLAVALGISTFVITAGLLATLSWRTLAIAGAGLAQLAIAVGGATALAFGALSLTLSPIPAALLGVFVYTLIILALR